MTHVRRHAVAIALPALAVLLIALAVRAGWTAGFDRAGLRLLSPSRGLLPFALAATWVGDVPRRLVVTALAAGVLLLARQPLRAAAFAGVVLGGPIANSVVKWLVARPRPDVLPHLDIVHSTSFPSGHAASAVILYVSLALLMPARFRPTALVLAAAVAIGIGLSRVALAVHWPSDVLAGWLFGLAWVLAWRPWLRPRPVDPA